MIVACPAPRDRAVARLFAASPKLLIAVKLILALHETAPHNQVPGSSVRLDPKAKEQLEEALKEAGF